MAGTGSNAHPPITSPQNEFQSGGEKIVGTMLYQNTDHAPAPPQRLLKTPHHKQQDTRDSSSATLMTQQRKDGLSSGLDTVVRHRTPQSQSLFQSNRIGQSPTLVLRKYRSPAKDKPRYTRKSGKVEESPVIHPNLACSQNEVHQLHPMNLHHDILRTHESQILLPPLATHRPRSQWQSRARSLKGGFQSRGERRRLVQKDPGAEYISTSSHLAWPARPSDIPPWNA
jgi:hypothetical protein